MEILFIRLCLRRYVSLKYLIIHFQGIKAELGTIFLSDKHAYSGPNFELEAALLRFYVVVCLFLYYFNHFCRSTSSTSFHS